MSTRSIALSAAIAFGLCAPSTQAAPPAPPHPPAPAVKPDGAPPVGQDTAQGQVQRMLINPYGEVDGLRLTDGTGGAGRSAAAMPASCCASSRVRSACAPWRIASRNASSRSGFHSPC